MGFGDAIRTCFQKYATISGRASRSEYWWFVLFVTLAGTVPVQIGSAAQISILVIIGGVVSLATIVPSICVGVRRMHDLDKSGWLLLVVLIPLIGALLLLYWFVQVGTSGSNQYGKDPIA